jgi:hypothetical protein
MAIPHLHSVAGAADSTEAPSRLQVETTYASIEEFVREFSPVVEANHLVLTLDAYRPCGSLSHFSVRLADGTVAFEGVGCIVELIPPRDGRRLEARLELVSLDEGSAAMHTRLLVARQEAAADEDALFDGVTTMFARGTVPVLPRPRLPLAPPPEEESTKICSPAELADALATLSTIEKQDSEDTRVVPADELPIAALRPQTEAQAQEAVAAAPRAARGPRVLVRRGLLVVATAASAIAAAGVAYLYLF